MKRFSTRKVSLIVIFSVLASGLFAQTFTDQGITLPGIANGSTLWGDADNDGDIDILLAGYNNGTAVYVKLYRNAGSNSFSDAGNIFLPAIPSASGQYTMSAQWVDFDNDGFIDILLNMPTSSGGSTLLIYRHEADHSYLLKSTINYWTWQGNSMDCGDYDNDGDQDVLLVTNGASRIFQNQGNFAFIERTTIALEGLAEGSSKFGDYDNDGDLDILITGFLDGNYSAGTYRIYRNNGNNSFTLQSNISITGNYDGSADWGDYNNDGYLDILITGKYGNTRIFKNDGNNTFSLQNVGILIEVTESAGKWGDLDNDGDLDIVISGKNNNINTTKAYINNGNNTFTELAGFSVTGLYKSSIDLFDYDNDRDLDILISGDDGVSRITKVFTNGSTVNNPVPAAPTGLTTETLGNDIILRWSPVTTDNTPAGSISYNVMVGTSAGGVNIVSPNSAADGTHRIPGMGNAQLGTSFVLRNLPSGTTYYWKVQAVDNSWKGSAFTSGPNFTYSSLIQASALNVPVRDGGSATLSWIRGNGTNCVVFLKEANTGTAIPSNGTVYTGSSVFKSGTQIPATGWYCVYNGIASTVSVTNLKANTDYIFQVIEYTGTTYNISTSTENPYTFKTGSFTEIKTANLLPVSSIDANNSPVSCYWVDIDNDAGNDLDLILQGSSSTRIYRNDGSNIFTLLPSSLVTGYGSACGDFNNDGLIDLAIASSPNDVLYRNTGGGSFTEQVGAFPIASQQGSMDWGDYDNDGDLDILIIGQSSTQGRTSRIFRNEGGGSFTEQQSISLTGFSYGTAKWVDFDNDGYIDLMISGYKNDASIKTLLYRNEGNNKFTEQPGATFSGGYSSAVDWGDYDNDGNIDLVTIGNAGYVRTFHNNGNNTFTNSATLLVSNYGSVKWGDYDNDGDLDILLTGFNGLYKSQITKIFKNEGNNSFVEDQTAILPGIGSGSASWGDYDKDGDLDIILAGNAPGEAIARIYRNDNGTVNTVPAAPIGIVSSVHKSDVTLKWDSVITDLTPYKAMTYNLKVGTLTGAINIMSPNSAANGQRRVVIAGNASLGTTFLLKKMAFGNYFWSVQAVDNGFTGSAFSGEGTFVVSPVQAGSLSAKIINNNSLLLKWDRGNGDRCVVFAKQTSTGVALPINNTGYVADPEFGFGSQIGTSGWYCVYNGRADSVNVTGLLANKQYSFHIIEYMGTFGSEQYFTVTADGNPGVFSTSLFTEQTGITINSGLFNNVSWGDYDNDGFTDLLVPNSSATRIYRNLGNNTFQEKTGISLPGVNNGCAEWGDYDNDGDLDIIITGSAITKIYRNNGSDVFTEQTLISLIQLLYSSVAWGDYDNDGDLDILLNGAYGTSPNYIPVTKIYENNGNNTFSEQTQIALTGLYRGSVRWTDYDNDGDLDIAITGAETETQWNTEGLFKIYKNNGNKTFTEQTIIGVSNSESNSATSWGDFDNDGDLDFMITAKGYMALYKNLGGNNFNRHMYVSLAFQGACYSAWGDYDNDGYLDIILSNPGLDTKIYRNTHGIAVPGAITQWFNKQDDEAVQSIGYSFVNWIDYDNDGDLDFLLSYYNGLPTKIFKNNLVMKSGLFKTNTSPVAPIGLKAINSPTGVVLSWKPVLNDETPSKTMTYNVRIGTAETTFNISPPQSSAAGYRHIATIGNAQLDTTFLLLNMPATKYYWSVQAVDQGLKGGAWSATGSVDVKNVLSFFNADEVCMGLSTKFTNQSVAFGDVIQSYKWLFGDGATSTLTSPTYQFTTSGVKNVTLIAYSATTSDTLIKQVLVKAKPILDFSASVACQGSETFLTNLSNVTGLTITSWSWDYGDGKGSTSQNPGTHGYLTAGDYQLTLTAAADNLCSSFITKTVSVGAYPLAAISASTPLSFCSGDSVKLFVAKNASYIYKWLAGGAYLPGQDSSKYVAKSTGTYTAEVVNPTGNCKTTSAPASVTVLNAPSAPTIISGKTPAVFCQGDSVSLSVTNTTGYTYGWKLNGGAVGSNKNEYFCKNPGRYNLIVENSTGCLVSSSNFIDVVVNPLPTVSAVTPSGATDFCSGGSVTLSVTLNAGYSYSWSNEAGPISSANTNSYIASTSGKYKLDVTNSFQCVTKTNPVAVAVLNAPSSPTIISGKTPAVFCQGDSVSLSVTNTTGYTYSWKLNGGAVGSNKNEYFAKNIGKYTLNVANSTGCQVSSSNFIDVVVNPLPAVSAVIPGGATDFCSGGSVTLSVTLNAGYSYSWSNEAGPISNAKTNSYTATTTGKYKLDATNSFLCVTRTNPVTVTVKPNPVKPVISSLNYQDDQCPPIDTKVKLLVSNEGIGYKYQWYKNGITYTPGNLAYIEGYLQQGDYSVESDLSGCKLVSDNKNIRYIIAPEKPIIYVKGPVVWYMATSLNSYKNYKWYYNNQLITGATKYLYVANKKLGTYRVEVANENLCFTSSNDITIPVSKSAMTTFNIPPDYLRGEETDALGFLKIYPNPSSGIITIEMDNELTGDITISVLTLDGKEVVNHKSVKSSDNFYGTIDLTKYSKGNYFIKLDLNNIVSVRKIILE